jgi:hypothetical protein
VARGRRLLRKLRGQWPLEREDWAGAADSFIEAVRMAREAGRHDTEAEACLALARWHLNQLCDPRQEAERLSIAPRRSDHRELAELWLAIGDREQATRHALVAYCWAWADGEPYVRRFELISIAAVLEQLGVPIPLMPPYAPPRT